jgi:hypothetical protein
VARPVKHRGKWRVRWLDEHGVRKSAVFDAYNDAVFKLRERQQAVEEIHRGLRPPEPEDHKFSELCDYWLTKRNVLKRSRKDDESIVRKHLRPSFGALFVRDVTLERVDAFVAERMYLHKNTVAHLLTLLISMLNLSVELGWLIKVAVRLRHSERAQFVNFAWPHQQPGRSADEFIRGCRATL